MSEKPARDANAHSSIRSTALRAVVNLATWFTGAAIILAAPPVLAAPVVYQYSGTVLSAADPAGLLPLTVSDGDSYTIRFTWDDAVADEAPGDAYWLATSAVLLVELMLPTGTITYGVAGPSRVEYFNDFGGGPDLEDLFVIATESSPASPRYQAELTLQQVGPGAPGAFAAGIPAGPGLGVADPADFGYAVLTFGFTDGVNPMGGFSATVASVQVVPLPPALALFGSALALAGVVRRGRAAARRPLEG